MQVSLSKAAERHRLPWRSLLVVVALFSALALSACGDDDDDDDDGSQSAAGPSESSAPAPKGEPIKTMTITSLNSQGPVYPNIQISAEAYEQWINANGGIAGRPLEVQVCDEKGDPTEATACARKAVNDQVAAVVGSFTFLGDNVIPILDKAEIPWFGVCCAITAGEFTSKVSFPVGNQPMYAVGLVKRAVEDGCENINAVIIDGAQGAFQPVMENAMKAFGQKFGKTIILPATSQDYTAQVAEAASGDADCVVMVVSETPYIAWMPAWTQSGTEARMYGPQGNLNEKVAKGHEQSTDGDVIAGMYPDISTEPWADYRQALEDADAPDSEDYNSLGGMGTWAAYTAFTQIAEGVEGPIDNQSFLEAASNTSSLDLNGMVPVLDFTTEWSDGLKGYERLFNRSVVFSQLKDGKVEPLTTEFEDVSDLALGKPAQ